MYEQPKWGTVNLGVDTLQGHGEQSQPGYRDFIDNHQHASNKQQYNPGRNQELNLPPDIFRMQKETDWNPYSPDSKMRTQSQFSVHERIKELLGEGWPRRAAVAKAKQEGKQAGVNDGNLSKKEIYRYKYQAEQPGKYVTPFHVQEQEQPFM